MEDPLYIKHITSSLCYLILKKVWKVNIILFLYKKWIL